MAGVLASGCGWSQAGRQTTPDVVAPAPIEFIVDDYASAHERALASHKPLVVEAWARWCAPCLSLKTFVLRDPGLRPLADRFVWLSVDTDKPNNAWFVAKFASDAWPTLWVIDAADEAPILRWTHAATTAELSGLLDDAARTSAKGGAGDAETAAARGDRAAAVGNAAVATREYRASLAAAGGDWARRPRVVDALIEQLGATKDWSSCVELAMGELPDMPAGTPRADVARAGLACAAATPRGSPTRQSVAALAAIVRRIALDPNYPILAFDRSELFEALVDHYREEKDEAAAAPIARAWSTFLDDAAQQARSPAARTIFDEPRLSAYLESGEPDRAIAMLQQSERELPEESWPAALLARAYASEQRWSDAIAAIDRALSREYGPHKLRTYEAKFDLLFARGDKPHAKKTLEEAIDYGKQLPPLTGGYAKLLADFKARVARL